MNTFPTVCICQRWQYIYSIDCVRNFRIRSHAALFFRLLCTIFLFSYSFFFTHPPFFRSFVYCEKPLCKHIPTIRERMWIYWIHLVLHTTEPGLWMMVLFNVDRTPIGVTTALGIILTSVSQSLPIIFIRRFTRSSSHTRSHTDLTPMSYIRYYIQPIYINNEHTAHTTMNERRK